jgi:hypothetical protein
VSLLSTLEMTLVTRFACAPTERYGIPPPVSAVEAGVRARHNAWMEHDAAPVHHGRPMDFPRWSQHHKAHVALDVRSSQPSTEPRPVHYRDPAALAPTLALPHTVDEVTHAPLSQHLRPERDAEPRWEQYTRRHCRTIYGGGPDGYPNYSRGAACGGENKHAAKVWAYAEAVAAGLPVWERDETFVDGYY